MIPSPGLCQTLCIVQEGCNYFSHTSSSGLCLLFRYRFLSSCQVVGGPALPSIDSCQQIEVKPSCASFVRESCTNQGDVVIQKTSVTNDGDCQELLQLVGTIYGAKYFVFNRIYQTCTFYSSEKMDCDSVSGFRSPGWDECHDSETSTTLSTSHTHVTNSTNIPTITTITTSTTTHTTITTSIRTTTTTTTSTTHITTTTATTTTTTTTATTTTTTTTTTTSTTPGPPEGCLHHKCVQDGLFPEEPCSRSYCQCDGGRDHLWICGGGLYFNPVSGVCDWKWNNPFCM